MDICSEKTAIHRTDLSRPIRTALDDHLITSETSVLDYGCGHGDDVRRLSQKGVRSNGWDPFHRPKGKKEPANVVNLGYVLNVIDRASARAETIREAWGLTKQILIVAARLTHEAKGSSLVPSGDGFVTGRNTFQRYYEQQELRDWIDATLGETSVAAAPGIFYVFRDPSARQSFVAARFRRRLGRPRTLVADRLFEENKELLESLIAFVVERGRLPRDFELTSAEEIQQRLGSIRRAFSVVRRVTGSDEWERISAERSEDLLVYIALARFGQRAKFGQLPEDLRFDVRAFFSTYKRACALADYLLFSVGVPDNVDRACRGSSVGKLTRSALYVHTSAFPEVPSLLRVYEGCARALVGSVEGSNVVKLHRFTPEISYLTYADFEREPHPRLRTALLVNLQTFRIRHRDYSDSDNPPILHRKEAFVSQTHPDRDKFARLTRQEERWGLYDSPADIGTRKGWELLLARRRLQLKGHRVTRKSASTPDDQPIV